MTFPSVSHTVSMALNAPAQIAMCGVIWTGIGVAVSIISITIGIIIEASLQVIEEKCQKGTYKQRMWGCGIIRCILCASAVTTTILAWKGQFINILATVFVAYCGIVAGIGFGCGIARYHEKEFMMSERKRLFWTFCDNPKHYRY